MNANLGAIKIQGKRVRPTKGFAFIKMAGIYDNLSGLIAIPEKSRSRRHGFGEIVDANPTDDNDKSISMSFMDTVGFRAIFDDYSKTPIIDDIYRIPIAAIVAVVSDDSIQIGAVANRNGVERCQWCGPAKSGSPNSMLCDEFGYCYRCGKNAAGDKRDPFSEKSLEPFMKH